MANKERENFYRGSTLIVDNTKTSFVDLLELHLSRNNISFEDFITQHQHQIYHLYNTTKCCHCFPGFNLPNKRILYYPQLEILFDKHAKKPGHNFGNRSDFCCARTKTGITTDLLDITLTRTLLVNFCHDVFWYSCLTLQSQSLPEFLNKNKHTIYHLRKPNIPCCQCPPGYIFLDTDPLLDLQSWEVLFNLPKLPCPHHQMVPSDFACTVSASRGIKVSDLGDTLTKVLIEQCCPLRKTIEKLILIRNKIQGHASEGRISEADYRGYEVDIALEIMEVAKVCKNEAATKQSLSDVSKRSLDETLCIQYQNTLLEQILMEKRLEEKIDDIRNTLPDIMEQSIQSALKKINESNSTLTIETCTNRPARDENTRRRNAVTLIEDLAAANEPLSKTKKALKKAFEVLSVIKDFDRRLSAIVTTAEKILKIRHDKKLDDILKLVESKIDEELFYKFTGAKAFFVSKISFLTGVSIHEINENDIKFIEKNVEPFKEVKFMAELSARIDKEKKLGKRRNFLKLMKYTQEYIILSVLRDITFTLYLRILDLSSNFNISIGVENMHNSQTENNRFLFDFLVEPLQDTLVYNFMYNPNNWKVVDNLLEFYFPDQGNQHQLEHLCNGKYVIKSVKFNGAFLYMVDIAGTWLRWQKQETDQSEFTFSKTDINGKTYFKICSSKWKTHCAIIGGLNIWARGIGSSSDNEGLFEIIKFKKNKDSKEDLYSFSPKDSKATFLIANESGRVSGSQCPPCPETFFKIELRNSLTT